MTTYLATNRTGRVLLHLFCLAKRPSNAAWHWRGIMREFEVASA